MSNKRTLSSLAMDLRRVALGYHRGSTQMARRFFEEALKRKREMDMTNIKPYLKVLLLKFPAIKNQEDQKIAEDALTYSILFQNASVKSQ